MNFQGELLHGGLVVLERVAGLIGEQTQPDGSTAWSGAFLISPGLGPDVVLQVSGPRPPGGIVSGESGVPCSRSGK
jgi:hypothetical protein